MSQAATIVWQAFERLPRPLRVLGWILGVWILPVVWLAARGTTAGSTAAGAFLLLVTIPTALTVGPGAIDAPDGPADVAVADVGAEPADAIPAPTVRPTSVPAATPSRTSPAAIDARGPGVLGIQRQIDGDSFVATDGVEYRVSMINTPELGECGAEQANEAGYALLGQGFTSVPTGGTTYGRTVAVVTLVDGSGYGIRMAREGWVDDRYLDEFRYEAPEEARLLEEAFAAARAAGAGLWATCWASPASVTAATPASATPPSPAAAVAPQPLVAPAPSPAPSGGSCHPAYVECLPMGPDLDCAAIGHRVHLTGDDDPYRLDGSTTSRENGIGCESY